MSHRIWEPNLIMWFILRIMLWVWIKRRSCGSIVKDKGFFFFLERYVIMTGVSKLLITLKQAFLVGESFQGVSKLYILKQIFKVQ